MSINLFPGTLKVPATLALRFMVPPRKSFFILLLVVVIHTNGLNSELITLSLIKDPLLELVTQPLKFLNLLSLSRVAFLNLYLVSRAVRSINGRRFIKVSIHLNRCPHWHCLVVLFHRLHIVLLTVFKILL